MLGKFAWGVVLYTFFISRVKNVQESLEEDKEFLFYIWLTYDNTFFRNWRFFNDC